MAVVGTLDLHDEGASGQRTHDPHGIQRRLGARVPEAPIRQPVPLREVLRHHQRVFGRLREMRSQLGALLHGLDDLRMRVSHHHHAVAVVVVDVLVGVDVPDP